MGPTDPKVKQIIFYQIIFSFFFGGGGDGQGANKRIGYYFESPREKLNPLVCLQT